MNITLVLDDELVETIRQIAVEKETTLAGLVRDYLEKLAVDHTPAGRRQRQLEALERSFEQFRFTREDGRWSREDLHERS